MGLVKTNDLNDIYARLKELSERLLKLEEKMEAKNNVQSSKPEQRYESRRSSHEYGTQGKPSDG